MEITAAKVRRLAYRSLAALGQYKLLQAIAARFWRSKDDSFFASEAYYDHREEVLRALLAQVGTVGRALDVGCGNGRFTLMLTNVAGTVDAFDLSPELIQQAVAAAEAAGCANVRFEVADLNAMPLADSYGLALCMGVISCLLDDGKWERLMVTFRERVEVGGHLVLVDTVTTGAKPAVHVAHNGYVAKYRSLSGYQACVARHGFEVLHSEELATWSPTLTNRIWLARRTDDGLRP